MFKATPSYFDHPLIGGMPKLCMAPGAFDTYTVYPILTHKQVDFACLQRKHVAAFLEYFQENIPGQPSKRNHSYKNPIDMALGTFNPLSNNNNKTNTNRKTTTPTPQYQISLKTHTYQPLDHPPPPPILKKTPLEFLLALRTGKSHDLED